jgi:hypothetical protein
MHDKSPESNKFGAFYFLHFLKQEVSNKNSGNSVKAVFLTLITCLIQGFGMIKVLASRIDIRK